MNTRSLFNALILAAGAWLLAACAEGITPLSDGFAMDLTAKNLDERLAPRFPVKKCQGSVICLTLSEPQVVLAEGSNRLGLSAVAVVEVGGTPLAGRISLSGLPQFEAATTALMLKDVRIDSLGVAGVPSFLTGSLQNLAQPFVKQELERSPLYSFAGDSRQDQMARKLLKEVSVVGGKLRLRFGV